MLKSAIVTLVAVCATSFVATAAETIKCADTRDVWISAANSGECDTNGGKAPRIKLKIWQEFGLLDFDVSALKGKKIEKAVLYVAPAGGGTEAGRADTDLRWFTVSTVSSDWVEGNGAQYSKDEEGKGATFNEASYKTRKWSYPGSHCWDVILGNGKTLRCDVDAGDPKNGWFEIPLDKRLVEALVAKAAYGFCIMDGSTGVDRNSYIASKESGNRAPYLMVTVGEADAQAPGAPTNLVVKAEPNDANATQGAAMVTFNVPEGAFAYDIKINGNAVPRWQIPFASAAGKPQSITFEYLQPDAALNVEVCAIDAAGNVSPAAKASGKSSAAITVPKLPEGGFKPAGGQPKVVDGKLKIWAFPEICKLDPLTGEIFLEPGMEQASSKNSVWDGGNATVRIAAARGDIAGFQLALEALQGAVSGVKISINGIDDVKTRVWRTWYVKTGDKWQPEYAIPVAAGGAIAVPSADTKVPNQKATAVGIDLIIPESAKPGERTGTITISGEGIAETTLNLKLKIYNATIPKDIHFNPEMNTYGGPGQAGSEFFLDHYRIAHYHRSTINRVPYSQSGNVHADWVPAVGADGKVTDWSNFDKNLGPLLDGSAFKDNPRASVPVPVLYMPHHENWPMPFHANYDPGGKFTGKNWKMFHDVKAKAPEQAFTKAYQDGFTNCVTDFVKHFEDKGWTKTVAHFYNNNKHQFGQNGPTGTAWMMDEPNEYLDWHALNFYSRLCHAGMKNAKNSKWAYRGDISRPMWQGSCSDGLMEIMYVNGDMFRFPPLVKDQKRRMPTVLMLYGGANAMTSANHDTTAWCVKAYVYECDGVLPWQSIGGDQSFDVGDGDGGNGNMLIVDGSKRFGVNAIASYRMHAFRAGAQICELLRLLELKNGWGRTHSNALVSQLIPLGTEFKQAFADDAAAVKFKGLNGDMFTRLKEGILMLLEKQ
ncbi:MAG TPA: hypothetical protein VEJ63_16305 [Planctomycetota bacterium]|nr:hypothetical protein [Planctomycetota bacterium]